MQLQQTHYSDPRASTTDPRYGSAFTGGTGSSFSPIALAVRANPTETAGVTLRAEYDAEQGELKTLQLAGTLAAGSWLSTSGGWSRSLYAPSVLEPTVTAGAQLSQLALQRDARTAACWAAPTSST